jgi:hypothetical protein
MSASDSILVLIIGVPLSFLGLCFNQMVKKDKPSEEPKRDITKPIEPHLKLEYETLNEEVKRRSEVIIGIAGTVFVIASFVLLGQSATSTNATVKLTTGVTALPVYAFYLYVFSYTSA